jgi:hypothetical protein
MANNNSRQNTKRAPSPLQPSKRGGLGDDAVSTEEAEGYVFGDDDDDDDLSNKLVQVVCIADTGAKFEIGRRRYRLRKGQIAEIEAAYGTPRVFRQGGDPLPSVVELETGRKVLPVSDPRVDKNEAGVPLVTVTYRAAQAKLNEQAKLEQAALTPSRPGGQPTGA